MILKNKMVAASRGYDLLKRKADALMIKFRSILKDIEEVWILSTLRFSS